MLAIDALEFHLKFVQFALDIGIEGSSGALRLEVFELVEL